MKKDYIPEGAERRYFVPQIEVRNEGEEDGIVTGIAAVIGKKTDLGWADEMIEAGAFDEALNDDVVALFNHDPNFPLARSVNGQGTLELSIDDEGNLAYSYRTPNRTYARDLLDAIRSGDVSKSSFAFTVKEEEWVWADDQNERDLRIIKKVGRLYDVSPVTYPAYNDTSVAARSMTTAHQKEYNLINYRKRIFNAKHK